MTLSEDQYLTLLRRTIELAAQARQEGNHPFGALLADADGKILIEAGNNFAIEKGPGHAEAIVARQAAVQFSPEQLLACTLVTSVEPCAMCAGATYWAGIGALAFGITEKRLAVLTGDNPENLTMDMPCQKVFAAGQRTTQVFGPFNALESEIVKTHENFWN